MATTSRTSSIPPCKACQDRPPLTIDFSMAFQPIIDVRSREVFAYDIISYRNCFLYVIILRICVYVVFFL